jgi:glycosyltransferase involved in cell wall biosynthesis
MRSFIVVVSPSYGGAERRFFDIFTELRRKGADVALIAPSSLLDELTADHPDRADVFGSLIAVEMQAWSRLAFIRKFRRLLRTLPRGSSFHYPLNCLWPLHLARGDRVSMSVADCTSVPGPLAGKRTSVWAWLSFFFAARIDVLSPSIFADMQRFRSAPKMSLTPGGTFLAGAPRGGVAKAPIAVLLGRLVAGKGVDDLLDVAPEVWSLARARLPAGFEFQIAGYGPLESHVAKRVERLARARTPIRFVGYAPADAVLPGAALVLSMQEVTNYPSRVVAEALMAGCAAIVRDTGDSREFGSDLPGLVYCRAELDARELADQIASLVDHVLHVPGFAREVCAAASTRFSGNGYIEYFRDVVVGAP